MGKAYIGETVLVQEEQIINNAPTKVLTLNEDDEITVSEALDLAKEIKDLPDGFIISCTGTYDIDGVVGTALTYFTDRKRLLQVEPQFVPVINGTPISIFVEGNDIFFCYNEVVDGNNRTWGVGALYGCKIINNILVPTTTDYQVFPGFITTISPNVTPHAEAFKDGYLYYTTREAVADSLTRVVKVNTKNLRDIKIVTPFTGGGIHNIEIYGNYIYFMKIDNNSAAGGHIGRIDLNLNSYEVVFNLPTSETRYTNSQMPFLIYNDEFYIPSVNNPDLTSRRNNLIMSVYGMDGHLRRESIEMPIATEGTTLRVFPHWISAFNNKLIIHTASGNSGVKRIIRVNCGYGVTGESGYIQPFLEETIVSPLSQLTDDNIIDPTGRVWLNSEISGTTNPEARLLIIDDYNDFTTAHVYDNEYYRSLGTPPTKVNRENYKATLKDFSDFNKVTQSISVNGGTPYVPDPSTGNIDITVSGGGGATNLTYTASPTNGTVNSDTGTDAIIPLADGTNAGLLSPSEKTKIANAPTGTGLVYYTDGVAAMIVNISSSRYVKTDGSSGNFNTDVRNNAVKASALVANTAAPVNNDNATMIAEKLLSVYNNVQTLTSYVSKTASYTISDTDMVVDLTANTATFTLPTAIGIAGRRYTVKNSGTGVLTVNTTSSQTIDGAASMSFNTQYAGMTVVSDGANWKIISNF